jgi:hypothetical protein
MEQMSENIIVQGGEVDKNGKGQRLEGSVNWKVGGRVFDLHVQSTTNRINKLPSIKTRRECRDC